MIPNCSGKDAFHRVPDDIAKKWDAVERVPTGKGIVYLVGAGPAMPVC